VIRACLDAGVDYLDVQFAASKLLALRSAENEIRQAGRCFVTEAGYHPGLPSAMVRYAAARMETIESARTACFLNMADLPYTEAVDELMEAFKDYHAQVFKNGAWTRPSSWDMRRFDFESGIGSRMCYSMFFEEMRALPDMYPTLKETGFYISGTSWLADLLVTPIVMAGLKLAPQRGLRPLGRLMWWAMGKTRPPHLVALMVEAHGRIDGRPTRVRAQISHPDGYELTAIPVVAFLLQYLDGSARRPGLHMMGHLANPVRLFDDMQKMGVEVRTDQA
jgi:saccharopine dehydrogenase (NAD+, L-lysine-forming)